MSHDDDGIIVKDTLDIVETLQGEGSLVVLQEGGNDHTYTIVPGCSVTVEDVITGSFVQSESQRLNLIIVIESKGDILHEGAVIVFEGKAHGHTATDDAVTQLVEIQLRITQYSGITIMQQFVEHLIAVICKQILHRGIVLTLDSRDNFINRLRILFGLFHGYGMSGCTCTGH